MRASTLALPVVFATVAAARSAQGPRIEPSAGDGELVKRVRGGDRWAAEALYQRHVRTVMRVVLRLLARNTDAEDVVQDAFIIAFSELGDLRDDDSFRGWLLRIAVRQVHRRFRRRRVLRALGLDRGPDDATLAHQVDPSAGPDVLAALSEVDRLVRTLPAPWRVAWILRHVEGHELGEVADACDCSLATAKRWIGRADEAIRLHVRLTSNGDDDE